MKVFQVGDIVTFKDQYDPGCTGDDYPHLFPGSCKGAAGVIIEVHPDRVDPQEKHKKMYNHDDYLYEVEVTVTNNPGFFKGLHRAKWHGSCFKEYGTVPNVLLYRKDTRVLIRRIPGVCDWRENYSPYGVIVHDVYTLNSDNFYINVKDLRNEDRITSFCVGAGDVEPAAVQKSPSVEERLSKIDDFISRCEELDTPPEPQVSKKVTIRVSVNEVKITIPKTVLPTIKI
ncbi:MAG: hypothetical protein Q4C49_01100 [Bacillota bacterium]|nr:hypothetical protein [Bacillota bacterium]